MFRAVVLTVLAACAQIAHGQVLWQGLSAGMTVDEVRSATPTAQSVNNPTIKLVTGAQGKLRAPGVDIAGKPFEATFFFVGDRLNEVQLTHESKGPSSVGRGTYNELLVALRSKYGNEVKTGGAQSSQETTWLADGTTISLAGFFAGGETIINVNYIGGLARGVRKP